MPEKGTSFGWSLPEHRSSKRAPSPRGHYLALHAALNHVVEKVESASSPGLKFICFYREKK